MVCFFWIVGLLISANTSAQEAHFSGTVYTKKGAPVSHAHVQLHHQEKPLLFTVVSQTDGSFLFDGIEQGSYILTIQSLGFNSLSTPISFTSGEQKQHDYRLSPKTYTAGTMVITASRTHQQLEDVGVPLTVVDNKEIELSGSTRLSEILAEQTGLTVVSDHGEGIQVQGFDPDYTLIMIDNQPVIGRVAGTLDLDRISLGAIKQIEMVKGPSSALWGSDALAGVINIITEKPEEALNWDINGRYGSHTSFDGGTNLRFKHNKLQGALFGNINGSSGFDLNTTTIEPTVPEYTSYTFSASLDYSLSKRISIGIQSRYYRENQTYLSDIDIDQNTSRVNGSEFQEDYHITPRLSINLGSKQLFEIHSYLSRFNSSTELDIAKTGAMYSHSMFDQTFNKYELKSSTFWNDRNITVTGAGFIQEDLVSENYADVPGFNSYFSYGQHEWKLSPKLSVTAGFRFDAHSEYSSQLSPKFSGIYKPNKVIHIRASLGGGFKAPEFRQLFLNFTNPRVGYSVFGSSTVSEGIAKLEERGQIKELLIEPSTIEEIKAERSFAYNAGMDLYLTEDIQLRFNMFRNNVDDLIETQRIALKHNNQSVFSYFNLSKIYTRGVESEFKFNPSFINGLRITLGYQFLDARRLIQREHDDVVNGEVVTVTESEYIPILNRSKHSGNAKIYYTHNKLGLESSLRLRYNGRYWFTDSYQRNQQIDANEWSDPYLLVNASVAKRFLKRFRLQLGINNLTDYQSPAFLPSNPGITFYTQLNVQLH